MLKMLTLVLGLVVGLSGGLLALPARAQDTDAIQGVIANQLQAFNDRDVDTAFTFASPMIKGMFGTPQNFGLMVQNGYPMVWDNADVEFMELRDIGGVLSQRVILRGADGARWALEYAMVETPDGWQIDGVSIVPAPDVGA